jgi:hypothetical protein
VCCVAFNQQRAADDLLLFLSPLFAIKIKNCSLFLSCTSNTVVFFFVLFLVVVVADKIPYPLLSCGFLLFLK